MKNSRRGFFLQIAVAGTALAQAGAFAQPAAARLDENDPQAAALGYKQDTRKVDEKKFPKHEPSQTCATCQLFQGKATDAMGACPIFAGKQVAAPGWCSAWAKKAA